ncbi:MAG: diguanylate cyclase [Rhodobacteraceae bacterium]|nr:diguanylate cyclase [Paracoccaceae bacterium]
MVGRILVVDNVSVNRIILRVKLSAAGFEVLQCSSIEMAVSFAVQTQPDVIVASCDHQDNSGVRLCQVLNAALGSKAPPVLLLCGEPTSCVVLNALQAGAADVLRRPISDKLLLARVRNTIRRETVRRDLQTKVEHSDDMFAIHAQRMQQPTAHIALVMPPGLRARRCLDSLRQRTQHEVELLSPSTALRRVYKPRDYDLYVLIKDQEGPEPDLDAVTELRSTPSTRHAGIAVVLGQHQTDQAHRALDLGADDVMLSGIDHEELALRLTLQAQIKWLSDCLRNHVNDSLRAAVKDPLTGLHNRRYALNKLASISERSAHTAKPFAVMIADLDHFKAVNDSHGHGAGDAVLKQVAARLSHALPADSLLARIGGEEFLIALPDTDIETAETMAKQLCDVIAATPYRLTDGSTLGSTISIGLALCSGVQHLPPLDLIAKADQALYGAKTHGRNQVTVSRSAA